MGEAVLPTDEVVLEREAGETTPEVFSPYLAVHGMPVAVSVSVSVLVTTEVVVAKKRVTLYEVRKYPLKRSPNAEAPTCRRQRQR